MGEIKYGTNKFYIGDNESDPIAELTFKQKDEKTIIADHTFVAEELRGEGVAGKLFEELIAYARRKQVKIIPECPYIQKKMDKTSEYEDVLAQ